ncbi:MAG: hypothetical protein JW915_21685 [Chitinispirillaceae bacterium]|nr:hypothetical protein [Chitinispirillaceae bacterium]
MKKSALFITVLFTLLDASTTRTAYSVYFNDSKIGYILLSRNDGAPDMKIVDYTGAIKILSIDAK